MYTAIGNDGFREVVWGVGATEDAAREDAARWIGEAYGAHADLDGLDIIEITAEQAERIREGEVSWESLQLSKEELVAQVKLTEEIVRELIAEEEVTG